MADSRGGKESGSPTKAPPVAWRGLTAAALKYVAARGELAQIEAREAASHLVRALVFGVVFLVMAFGAWVLTVPALVWLVCEWMQWRVDLALIATGVVHALLAVIFLKATLNRLAKAGWFTETLEQFKKDRAWMLQETEKR